MKKISVFFSCIYLIVYFIIPIQASAVATLKIGDMCLDSSECLSGECEDGFCDCLDGEIGDENSPSCQAGIPGSPPGWKCVNEDDDPLDRGVDFCVKQISPSYPPNNSDTIKYPIDHKLKIGEKCAGGVATPAAPDLNKQCITGDCEDSAVDDPFDNYCVCQTAQHCFDQYGGSDPTDKVSNWVCSDDDDDVTHNVYYCKQLSTNHMIDPTGQKSDAGFMEALTNPEAYVQMFTQELEDVLRKPNPKIAIPGLKFSEIDVASMVTSENGKSYLNIPFIGEYLTAVYKYGMIAAGILAVYYLIDAGTGMILGGKTQEGRQGAQKKIINAITGLVIALLSYIILYTINPYLVQFKNLKILYVNQDTFNELILGGDREINMQGNKSMSNTEFDRIFKSFSNCFNIDYRVAKVISLNASGLDPNIQNKKGANYFGLFQTNSTNCKSGLKEYSQWLTLCDDIRNPWINSAVGVKMLEKSTNTIKKYCGGNISALDAGTLLHVGLNSGPGALKHIVSEGQACKGGEYIRQELVKYWGPRCESLLGLSNGKKCDAQQKQEVIQRAGRKYEFTRKTGQQLVDLGVTDMFSNAANDGLLCPLHGKPSDFITAR
ncbi:MAG: transglycosylase SLT domain-containing protein [Candidatus Magasanikbacteria bacterium]